MSKPTENDVHLWIGDMLPTIFYIFSYLRGRVDNFSLFKKRGSALRKIIINQYAEALHDIWIMGTELR